MPRIETKFGAQLAAKIERDELDAFIANAEACKSTKDIVLRELVYAFNRFCSGDAQSGPRFPVLQRLEVVAPGYSVTPAGAVRDSTPFVMSVPDVGYPTLPADANLKVAEEATPEQIIRSEAKGRASRSVKK